MRQLCTALSSPGPFAAAEWWLFEALVLMAGILPNPEQACAVPAIINLHDLYACSMLDQQCKTRTGLTLCSVM